MVNILHKTKTPAVLDDCFTRLGIAAQTYAHPPVFTVGQGEEFKHLLPGGHTKNLFLKDKHKALWLISAAADTVIDLKTLAKIMGVGRFSFGKPELLQDILGVTPGSVTPFALYHDQDRQVTPILDQALFGFEQVNFHPMRNDMTVNCTPQDVKIFIDNLGYRSRIVDFSGTIPNLIE